MPRLYPGYRDEIKKKIIQESYPVFQDKGYEGTKMDDIATRLGVTKPAIYRYLRDKDELYFAAVAEYVMDEFQKTLDTATKSEGPLKVAEILFDALLKANRIFSGLGRDAKSIVSKNVSITESLREYRQKSYTTLEDFFTRERDAGVSIRISTSKNSH